MESIKLELMFLFLNFIIYAVICCGNCGHGKCIDAKCVCQTGFWGNNCQFGRQRITKSPGNITETEDTYNIDSKLTWFIDSQRKNSSVELQLELFARKCSWGNLYIYDGRSIYDYLLAAFRGNMAVQSSYSRKQKLIAKSGTALVHFYSNRYLNEQSFNLSYRISNCDNQWCSDHGFCNASGLCECASGWTGSNCSVKVCCPGESYNIATSTYNCPGHIYGSKCPIEVTPRTSHASALQNTDIWIFGGFNFKAGLANDLIKYDTIKKTWQVVSPNPDPTPRFGHSMVYYNKKLFIYGGISNGKTTDELWEFDILTKSWKKLNTDIGIQPIDVTGHAAVVVGNKMYVFMGYSMEKSFYNGVQLFDMDTYKWSIIDTKGALILGTYGHSAVYDVISDVIFVYGGLTFPTSGNGKMSIVSDVMYTFTPTTKSWAVMPQSNHPRMLHSAVILGRLVVIYGGISHDPSRDQVSANQKQCFSNEVLAFDIACKTWKKVNTSHLLKDKGRFGHSAISLNRTAYIFGGFNGVVHDDVIPLSIGLCAGFTTRSTCLNAPLIVNCVWDKVKLLCLEAEKTSVLPSSQIEKPSCHGSPVQCSSFSVCENCLSNSGNCAWCKDFCGDVSCGNNSEIQPNQDINMCPAVQSLGTICKSFRSCMNCEMHPNCSWVYYLSGKRCQYDASKTSYNASATCKRYDTSEIPCYGFKTCSECTKSTANDCMWCQSQNRCIDSDSYMVNFAYGQCMEWTVNQKNCPKLNCSMQMSCKDCFKLPGCGWCENSIRTGLGKCMDGGYSGPVTSIGNATCPASRWHYADCPSCDCNGHSQCVNKSVCQRCSNNTAGEHCQVCKHKYYGNPLNNGTCKKCFCNGHGVGCDSSTGVCRCDTTGVVGDHCEKCEPRKFSGNASNGGFCFFRMPVGFLYTLNITMKKINFDAVPKNDRDDMEFEIRIPKGQYGRMNFSLTTDGFEQFVVKDYLIGSYKKVFPAEKYKFISGIQPIFKVYLYGWSKNAVVQISFDQKPGQLNWLHFLIVFLICFCSLLIILIVIWKLKQQYTNYQFNRRRREELREMASRPCGHVTLCCDSSSRQLRKVEPSQISLESFQRGSAAIASILVELPRTSQGYPPKGQTGLCIGSTLVTHRNQRILINAHQQLCIFRERRKNYRHNPVNV